MGYGILPLHMITFMSRLITSGSSIWQHTPFMLQYREVDHLYEGKPSPILIWEGYIIKCAWTLWIKSFSGADFKDGNLFRELRNKILWRDYWFRYTIWACLKLKCCIKLSVALIAWHPHSKLCRDLLFNIIVRC